MNRPITAVVVLALTAAVAGCERDDDQGVGPGPSAVPTLLVLPAGQSVELLAGVEGKLSVNEQGCVALGADPVVVENGTLVEKDSNGWLVRFADLDVPLGEQFVGAGGGGRRSES